MLGLSFVFFSSGDSWYSESTSLTDSKCGSRSSCCCLRIVLYLKVHYGCLPVTCHIPSDFLDHLEELRLALPAPALFVFLLKQVRSRFNRLFTRAVIQTLFMLFWKRLVIWPCRIVCTSSRAAWCGDTSSTQFMKRYNFWKCEWNESFDPLDRKAEGRSQGNHQSSNPLRNSGRGWISYMIPTRNARFFVPPLN